MKISYQTTNDGCGNVIVSVAEKSDLIEVAKTLDFISRLLFMNLSYDIDPDDNEVIIFVNDYYEFITLKRKLYDHCNVA